MITEKSRCTSRKVSHFRSKFRAQQYYVILWLSYWSKLFSRISCTETSFLFVLTISFTFFFFPNYIFRESTQRFRIFLEYIWSFCVWYIFNAYVCVFKWKMIPFISICYILQKDYSYCFITKVIAEMLCVSKSLVIGKVLSSILK